MDRRKFNSLYLPAWAMVSSGWAGSALALGLEDLSQGEAINGLRTALQHGAQAAVRQLGRQDGFWADDRVRIGLPGHLNDAAQWMRRLGQGAQVDELVLTMNRAAEQAVPMAGDLLMNAVRQMSVDDAKKILRGGDTSVTDFFARKTRDPLGKKFLPVVEKSTRKVQLAQKYNAVAGKAAAMGMVKGEDAEVERYVTARALDGLYHVIGEEERKIRRDPVGTGSAVLKKVFGALQQG